MSSSFWVETSVVLQPNPNAYCSEASVEVAEAPLEL